MHRSQRARTTADVVQERRSGPALARVTGPADRQPSLQFVTLSMPALAELEPQALGLTYWFDTDDVAVPYALGVRLTGTRLDVAGKPGPKDSFQVVAKLDTVLPRTGRVALTHRITGKNPGLWKVAADGLVIPPGGDRSAARHLPRVTGTGHTTYAPVAGIRAPGVVLGAWPALVGLGVVAALVAQSVLSRAHGLAPGRVLVLGLLASVVGLVGAKVYYRLTHLTEKGRLLVTGMSVQGFVVAAVATFLAGGLVWSVPFGHLLDTTVPALLIGQAIGRLGCFFGGCCVGLPTASRWGLWSSDRRVGQRRIPVQLMESTVAAVLAAVTFVVVQQGPPAVDGLVFVAGFGAYTFARQLLFPLRGLPRKTAHGRQLTLVVTFFAAVGSILALLVT